MKKFLILIVILSASFANAQPPGYYDSAIGLVGEPLKQALHEIIDDHVEYSYDDLRDFILMDTDEDPDNPNNIILLYTGRSQNKNTFGGGANDWNREHVWAKSHGDFGTTPPAGTDAHHMRPTDASVNSSRGNLDFDNGGVQHPEATGCYYDNDSWEPRDEVKGDVARMIFYMSVRYEGGGGEPDLEVVDEVNTSPAPEHGKFSTLYQWHQQDPPDAFEINRNEVIYSYQGNRNPFIDHPEFLILIYDPTNAVGEFSQGIDFTMYPNPANEFTTINFTNSLTQSGKLHVRNMLGQLIMTEDLDPGISQFKLNVSTLTDGLYIISMEVGGKMSTVKLSVRH
ncbi:MAG: endonuclease [Bacteroidales bacterium]|nr:endonuclease [Bacteroidales bacterium]